MKQIKNCFSCVFNDEQFGCGKGKDAFKALYQNNCAEWHENNKIKDMETEKIVQERIFFEPISDFLDVTVRVLSPYAVGSYKDSYTVTAVFCDGECFMDFVVQNEFLEQILDNPNIDRAIVAAQEFLNLERVKQFKQDLHKKYQAA